MNGCFWGRNLSHINNSDCVAEILAIALVGSALPVCSCLDHLAGLGLALWRLSEKSSQIGGGHRWCCTPLESLELFEPLLTTMFALVSTHVHNLSTYCRLVAVVRVACDIMRSQWCEHSWGLRPARSCRDRGGGHC